MNKQALFTALALVAGVGFSGAVAAQPTFPFNAYGGFIDGSEGGEFQDTNFSQSTDFGQIDGSANDPVYRQFGWGPSAGEGRSNLVINDGEGTHLTGSMEVSDPAGAIFGSLTHNNNPISDFWDDPGGIEDGPNTVDLDYYLDIFEPGADPDTASPIAQVDETFELEVWETQNQQANCPDGGDTPCADRFRYRLVGDGDRTFGDSFEDLQLATFNHGDMEYSVLASGFFPEGGGNVGEFWSAEGESSIGNVRIESHEVPSPGSLGLLGVGLMGLAWLGSRRTVAGRF